MTIQNGHLNWTSVCGNLRKLCGQPFGVVVAEKPRSVIPPYYGHVTIKKGLVRKNVLLEVPTSGKTWGQVLEEHPDHPEVFFFYPDGAPSPLEVESIPRSPPWKGWEDASEWATIAGVLSDLVQVAGDDLMVTVLPPDTPAEGFCYFLSQISDVLLVGGTIVSSSSGHPYFTPGSKWEADSWEKTVTKKGVYFFYPLGAPAPSGKSNPPQEPQT